MACAMYQGMQEALLVLVFLTPITSFLAVAPPVSGTMSLPSCPDKCGNVSIPYPFGIGAHCAAVSLNSYFNLTCNDTFHPPRLSIKDSVVDVEVTDISLVHGEMRVLSPINHNCFTSNTTNTRHDSLGYRMQATPFLPSPSRNRFTVIGCNTLGLIGGLKGATSQYVTGCYSYCDSINSTSDGAACAGLGCCEAAILANLTDFVVTIPLNESSVWKYNPCFYAMISEVGWYSFRKQDLVGRLGFSNGTAKRGAPIVVDWAIRNGSCLEEGKKPPSGYACVSANSYCMAASNGPGYRCQCSKGYEGNPYLLGGCQG